MTIPCDHPRAGLVTSHPLGGIEAEYFGAPVCDRTECIAWATTWVERMSGKKAHHVRDGGVR